MQGPYRHQIHQRDEISHTQRVIIDKEAPMTISMNLPRIRDEVGTQPDDNTLEEWFDELGHWLPVAIRVLKRRYADASAGGQEVSTFGLDGVLNVGFSKASLPGLAAQIARLEEQWAAEQGGPVSNRLQTAPLLRTDRYR